MAGVFSKLKHVIQRPRREAIATDHEMQSPRIIPDIYRKLDSVEKEIRLLYVQAGRANDPITCEFRYTSLSNHVHDAYETISYVWGDASVHGVILVEGQQLSVPASSEAVLRQFRHPKAGRTLWIDAICINQTDTEERNQQVAMMAEIYAKTSKNLIWLGEPSRGSTWAAEMVLLDIWRGMQRPTKDFQCLLETLIDRETGRPRYPDGNRLRYSRDDLDKLLHMYRSAWFTRIWGMCLYWTPRLLM